MIFACQLNGESDQFQGCHTVLNTANVLLRFCLIMPGFKPSQFLVTFS